MKDKSLFFKCNSVRLIAEQVLQNAKFQEKFTLVICIISKHWFSWLHFVIGYNVTHVCHFHFLYQRWEKKYYPYTQITISAHI